MNAQFFVHFAAFLGLQILAQVALRLGSENGSSMRTRRWWFCFLGSNAVGIPSILFLKELYKAMPQAPNVIPVMVMAGVFILTQLVFVVFFRSRLGIVQWAGVGLLAIGAVLATAGGR